MHAVHTMILLRDTPPGRETITLIGGLDSFDLSGLITSDIKREYNMVSSSFLDMTNYVLRHSSARMAYHYI